MTFTLTNPTAAAHHDDWTPDHWATPWHIVDACAVLAGGPFAVDLCARQATAKAPHFLGPPDDSLAADWCGLVTEHRRLWLNPPYSEQERWVRRAHETMRAVQPHGVGPLVICALLKTTTGSIYWHQTGARCRHYYPLGRVAFIDAAGEPQPGSSVESVVVLFGQRGSAEYLDLADLRAPESWRGTPVQKFLTA